MKKLILILAITLIAVPAFGAVSVTLTKRTGQSIVDVNYVVTDANLPRAFALDIAISGGAKFTAIGDYKTGESTSASKGYGIYPARIVIDGNGNVTSYGNPLADQNDPGAKDQILPSTDVVLEFGSLYVGAANAPATSGRLCSLTVDCNSVSGSMTVSGTIEATYRGGIVLENGQTASPTITPLAYSCITDCFPSGYTTYADWVTMGKPACWCAAYHCDGDADGITSGTPFNYRIYNGDLSLIITNWKKKIADYPATLNPCADVDHKSSGTPFNYRVYNGDLSKVITNWKKKDAGLPGDCPRAE